jgi:hypothetical protein
MNWRELKETIGFVTFKTDKHEEHSILNYINTNVLI